MANWPNPKSWYGLSSDQREWGKQIERMAVLYSDPVMLSCPSDPTVFHNGTGFLFRPGSRTFLITNSHVMQQYRNIREQHGNVAFQFGDVVFEPHVISEEPNEIIDLAVIDVEGIKFVRNREPNYWGSTVGDLEVYAPHRWPLAVPKTGEATVAVGWPGKLRAHETGGVEFAAYPMLGQRIQDVSATTIVIPFEREHWVVDFDATKKADEEMVFGGVSGCALFALHREGVVPLELVGIVRAHGEEFDVLYCTRADLIQEDGTIRFP